jgi:hypothetical protein
MTGKLLARTIVLLQNRPVLLTFSKIEQETDIPESWLLKLSRGKVCNPGVKRIEQLHAYLMQKNADLNAILAA